MRNYSFEVFFGSRPGTGRGAAPWAEGRATGQDSGGSQMHIAEKYSMVWCVHGITVAEIENESFGFDAACPGGGNSLTAKLLSRLFS